MHVSSKYNLELLSSWVLSVVECFKNKNFKTTINTFNKINLILFSGEKKSGESPNQFSLLDQATPVSGICSSNEHN